MFIVGINDSESDINSEARRKKFWMIPRNTIDQGINKLEVRNLKCSELGDISMKWRLFSAHSSLIMTTWNLNSLHIHYLQTILDSVNFRQQNVQKCNRLKFVSAWNFKHPKYLQYIVIFFLGSTITCMMKQELELGFACCFYHLKGNFCFFYENIHEM